nr:MAG TPA: hypothetical protein [Caudoviricetes sp.]
MWKFLDEILKGPEQSGLFCLRKPTENLWALH